MESNKVIDSLVEAREKLRQTYEQEIRNYDETIARLKQEALGADDRSGASVKIVPGEFIGMGMAEALKAYLNRRGGEASVERAALDLAIGGLTMGQPGRTERNLKICISNNRGTFQLDTDIKPHRVRLLKGPHAGSSAKGKKR